VIRKLLCFFFGHKLPAWHYFEWAFCIRCGAMIDKYGKRRKQSDLWK